jgi:hypothetical protein
MSGMGLPKQPVTLSVEQMKDLNQKLSSLRHDVNNHLSLIVAAAEVVRYKPQAAERMMATLFDQPPKIAAAVSQFSQEVERLLGITRD